ncbi:Spy/CpxP family protein refolding chaperone [Vulgatibacter incomptus]|nr:Spy/CpxP family protein refolding chaperone [Vulgatibacter incomptus]
MTRTRKSLIAAGLGLAAFLALSGFKAAHHGPMDPEKAHAKIFARLDKILTKVEATPEQRSRINGIAERLWSERPERDGGPRELLSVWSEESPDAAAIHAKIDQKAEARRVFANRMADAMIEVHGILTPAQRAQVGQLLEERFERGGRGHFRHGGAKE